MSKKAGEIYKQLSAPFLKNGFPDMYWLMTDPGKVNFTYTPYIKREHVISRLNEVLGVDGWQTSYEETTGKGMMCILTCTIDGKEITKSDIGIPSGYAPEKGAVTDALKRAAVAFGIGEYLLRIEPVKLEKFDQNQFKLPSGKKIHKSNTEYINALINRMHPLNHKLAEIYKALPKKLQEELLPAFSTMKNCFNPEKIK